MKIAHGRIVGGDEEAAILKGITEIEAGRGVSVALLRAKLRRR